MLTKLVEALIVDGTHVGSTPTRSTNFYMNQTTQDRKYTINFTDSDRAKAILARLIDHYMRTKHADIVEQMKQYITEQFENRRDTD